jgi:hypothetical protein
MGEGDRDGGGRPRWGREIEMGEGDPDGEGRDKIEATGGDGYGGGG